MIERAQEAQSELREIKRTLGYLRAARVLAAYRAASLESGTAVRTGRIAGPANLPGTRGMGTAASEPEET